MKTKITLIAIVLAVWSLLVVGSSAAQDGVMELEVETDDELTMYGWLTPSPISDKPAPLWVLLHQRAEDHTSWEEFIAQIARRFANKKAKPINHPHILAVDLRGHGKSTQFGDFSLSHANMRNEHFVRIPLDVAQMLQQLFKNEEVDLMIDTPNTVFIGASIGANAAIMATAELDSLPVRAVVMLSPGEHYADMFPMESMQKFNGYMLGITSTEDKFAAASMDYFEKKLGDDIDVIRYSAYSHGTGILDRHPESTDAILDWLLSPEQYQPKASRPEPAEDTTKVETE
ncbi:alpha/beta fold hydrolase [candidate division GN15 bacterium]|nr:alpha/beta fold hydrolase [candidate division GN15 bacterium]